MNKTIKNTKIKQQIINDNDEIDFVAFWHILIQAKATIIKITASFTTLGLLYVLFATPYYQSTISLYPAGEINNTSSLFGGNLQGIAQSFGVGIGGLGQAPTYNIPDIIDSRRLKKNIVLKSWTNNLYPDGSDLIKYWGIDKQKWYWPDKWLSNVWPSSGFVSDNYYKYLYIATKYLGNLIIVNEQPSGLITVSVLMEDPILAADIANYISEYVINFISLEQHREAEKNRKFIYDQQIYAKEELSYTEEVLTTFRKQHPIALDTPDLQLERGRLMRDIETNQAVYITMRQQYEIAKIEEAKENLLINILDIAEPAVKQSKPKGKVIIMLSIIVGGLFGIAIILIRNAIYPKK